MTSPSPHPYASAPAPQPMSPADEKTWATVVHIGALFFSFLVPLIAFLVLKDRGPFVRAHTATALNFQLSLIIYAFVGVILSFVLVGVVVLLAIAVVDVVFSVIAAVKASRGEWYRYPLSIRFVS
ncbi:DUF4870 domain-containing protein [Microbacterium sp. NPDC057407]|uniref:DUF4870 domain-containing protein n=1 Tax=Microbacterium sp. NPDC057407 TaxID=3346120 RepID=UPI003671CA43